MNSLHIIQQLLENATSHGDAVEDLIYLVERIFLRSFNGKVRILESDIWYSGSIFILNVEEMGRGLECQLRGEVILKTTVNVFPSIEDIQPYLDEKIGSPVIEDVLLYISKYPEIIEVIGNPFVYDEGSAHYKLSRDANSRIPNAASLEFLAEIHADYPRITNR